MSQKTAVKDVKQTDVAVQDERTVMGPLHINLARLVDSNIEVSTLSGLPLEFEDGETIEGFPPSPKFERKGDAVFGEFIGKREGVGPNKSRLYELSMPNGQGKSLTVAVWGSTIIDQKFDSCYPPIQQGDKVGFIYLGEKATARNQNPAKLFAIRLKRMTIAG